MAYPSPSDWTSPTPLSGWYLHRLSGRPTSVCASTGWEMLVALQLELVARLGEYGSVRSYDGTNVDVSAVPVNNIQSPGAATGWTPQLLLALYAVGTRVGMPASYLSAIQFDGTSGIGSVSTQTLRAGIWIGDGIYHGVASTSGADVYGAGSPDEVEIPDSTIMPTSAAPPVPSTGTETFGSVCNAIPASAESLIPVSQSVIPFAVNPWVVFGIGALAVGAVVLMSRDIPVMDPKVMSQVSRRSR